MQTVSVEDVEGFQTPEGMIKPLLFTGKAALLYVEVPPGLKITPHAHKQDSILYCIEGLAEKVCDGERTIISSGSAIFTPADKITGINNISDKPARFLHISTPPVAETKNKYIELLKKVQNDTLNKTH